MGTKTVIVKPVASDLYHYLLHEKEVVASYTQGKVGEAVDSSLSTYAISVGWYNTNGGLRATHPLWHIQSGILDTSAIKEITQVRMNVRSRCYNNGNDTVAQEVSVWVKPTVWDSSNSTMLTASSTSARWSSSQGNITLGGVTTSSAPTRVHLRNHYRYDNTIYSDWYTVNLDWIKTPAFWDAGFSINGRLYHRFLATFTAYFYDISFEVTYEEKPKGDPLTIGATF